MNNRNPSPLRYPGGKANFKEIIEHSILENGLEGCRYFEPFAGGAGAALSLLFEEVVSDIHLNDKDPAVYAFWKAVIGHNEQFCELIQSACLSVDEWYRQKEIYQTSRVGCHLELGFSFFYLNRTNRSGILKAGPIGGYDQTGNYKIDARFNKEALCERVKRIGLYADQIHLTKQEAWKFLKKNFDKYADGAYFYIDPPYYIKGQRLYEKYFVRKDHEDLAALLGQYKDKQWLLSYDDVEEINEIYRNNGRYRIDLSYSVAGARKASEIIIAASDNLIPQAELPKLVMSKVA
jgi:DNA adenine methylase